MLYEVITMMKGKIPEEIVNRPKQAYRAPILSSFVGNQAPEYVNEVISPDMLKEVAVFDSEFVSRLYRKMQSGKYNSEVDNMALVITSYSIHYTKLYEQKYAVLHQEERQSPFPIHLIRGKKL